MSAVRSTAVLAALMFALWGSGLAFAGEAVVEGTLWNASTDKPARAQEVELLALGQGMQRVATLQNVQGTFRFKLAEKPSAPHLVRVTYQGVHYNTPVHFGSEPLVRVESVVYETTNALEGIRVEKPHLFMKAEGESLRVDWALYLVNDPSLKRTVVHPDGTFRFSIPEDASNILHVTAQSGAMPISQSPRKLDASTYALTFPLKPGETEIRIAYEIPYKEKRYHLRTLIFYPIRELWLFVSPADVDVSAPGLNLVNRDEQEGFSFFHLHDFARGSSLEIDLKGGTQSQEPSVSEIPNHLARFDWPVILGIWAFVAFAVWVSDRFEIAPRERVSPRG